jgi:hypothetical protein
MLPVVNELPPCGVLAVEDAETTVTSADAHPVIASVRISITIRTDMFFMGITCNKDL